MSRSSTPAARGGRAPYGYRLRHEPHPDPRRARAGDTKSRLARDPEQAPVIVEMFQRFLAGSGYKEIADHLNRPGGPPPPRHVDSKRNTSGKWSKSTIRSILENHVYTGRLYWEPARLPRRQAGRGAVGPLVSEEDFERVQAEMKARSTGQGGNRRRYTQNRFYPLRGIVHCATGHNPLRMHGKHRKTSTYYTCGYRLSYGDTAAEATGHGKWQYVREDSLLTLIDAFFATRVFDPDRLAHFRKQSSTLAAEQAAAAAHSSGWRRVSPRRGRGHHRPPGRAAPGRAPCAADPPL